MRPQQRESVQSQRRIRAPANLGSLGLDLTLEGNFSHVSCPCFCRNVALANEGRNAQLGSERGFHLATSRRVSEANCESKSDSRSGDRIPSVNSIDLGGRL